jgi:hypothetical protein
MSDRGRIEEWLSEGGVPSTHVEFSLIRRLPWVQASLANCALDPIDAALMGMSSPPDSAGSLLDRVRAVQAGADLGVAGLAQLEAEAFAADDLHAWVSVARQHALASGEREASARRALSTQELPYVFPGELDPLMVEVLAAGEKVLPALHVDWVRKLTDWIAPALSLDCKHLGMWFWPVLRSLDGGRLRKPLARLVEAELRPGARGMVLIYADRLGVVLPDQRDGMDPLDERIVSLARLAVSQH